MKTEISFILFLLLINSSCKDENEKLAVVETLEITINTTTTATGGGRITDDGGNAVTQRGVCWDIAREPNTDDPKTEDGSGTGTYTSQLTDLIPDTVYFVRAYAVTSAGVAYGNEVNFRTVEAVP